jgi:hypothetical protein
LFRVPSSPISFSVPLEATLEEFFNILPVFC